MSSRQAEASGGRVDREEADRKIRGRSADAGRPRIAVSVASIATMLVGAVFASSARAVEATDACRAPAAADSVAPASSADARAAANVARRAVLARDADASARIDAAAALVEALPTTASDRLVLELHVLRTRMDRMAMDPVETNALVGAHATLSSGLDRIAATAKLRGENGSRAWALVYGAELALARGDREGATNRLDAALQVPEDDASWEAHVQAELLREQNLVAGDDEEEAIRGLLRARQTLERVRLRIDDARFLARARPVHERLASRLLASAAARNPSSASVAGDESVLREVVELLEALKLAELRAYFGDACLADLETTTPERLPGTFLLYPVLLEDRVELIVGHDGRLARVASPISPEELVSETRKLRGALQDPTSPRYRASATRLYDVLIRPLEAERAAAGEGATTLVVVPSGVLREIPFAALFDVRSDRYLVEQVALATLPSLHILPPEPLDGRRTRLLAAGLSAAVEDFPPLPFAARELEAATDRFPGARRLDAAFSKAGFAAALDAEPFDVVHIASHGRFDARASESFLLAYDGRLALAELGLLIGRTRHRTGRPLELLVLSACETAIGDERAVLGLAGVAVQSGARSAVASLWKVHDEATMQLFSVFYRELGRPGVSRAEALRRAQRALLAEPRFRHPIFWSAFLLVNGWL